MVKKTLVLGVSLNPDRYSNMAVRRLASNKVEVIAIGLKHGKINGINIENKLIEFKDVHTVKFFNGSKGYGFITNDETSEDIFVHATSLDGIQLNEGDKVEYSWFNVFCMELLEQLLLEKIVMASGNNSNCE